MSGRAWGTRLRGRRGLHEARTRRASTDRGGGTPNPVRARVEGGGIAEGDGLRGPGPVLRDRPAWAVGPGVGRGRAEGIGTCCGPGANSVAQVTPWYRGQDVRGPGDGRAAPDLLPVILPPLTERLFQLLQISIGLDLYHPTVGSF